MYEGYRLRKPVLAGGETSRWDQLCLVPSSVNVSQCVISTRFIFCKLSPVALTEKQGLRCASASE